MAVPHSIRRKTNSSLHEIAHGQAVLPHKLRARHSKTSPPSLLSFNPRNQGKTFADTLFPFVKIVRSKTHSQRGHDRVGKWATKQVCRAVVVLGIYARVCICECVCVAKLFLRQSNRQIGENLGGKFWPRHNNPS